MENRGSKSCGRREFLKISALSASGIVFAASAFGVRRTNAAEDRLKIGVVGSGRLGGTLGEIWINAGHEVMFSSLDIEHDKALAAKLGRNARAGNTREAAAFGEVILVAVPYSAMRQVGKELADLIKGKVIIDASNPIASRDGEIATWARDKGAGLASAELLPGARIVRAFNAIGYARLPEFSRSKAERVGMPIAGNDARALSTASRLIRDVGLEPVVVGPLAMGKHLIPGTALAGEKTPEQIRQIAATLK